MEILETFTSFPLSWYRTPLIGGDLFYFWILSYIWWMLYLLCLNVFYFVKSSSWKSYREVDHQNTMLAVRGWNQICEDTMILNNTRIVIEQTVVRPYISICISVRLSKSDLVCRFLRLEKFALKMCKSAIKKDKRT